MGIRLADQTMIFLYAILLGILLGLLYDIFRVSRIAIPTAAAVVAVEDILFFMLCAVVTFFYLLTAIDGRVRVFLVMGEIIGATLYYFTAGQVVMKLSKAIISAVYAFFAFIFRYFIYPVWKLFYFIVSLILRPFIFLGLILNKFGKKIGQKLKYSLKVRRVILYNHYKNVNGKIMRKRKARRREASDAEKKGA